MKKAMIIGVFFGELQKVFAVRGRMKKEFYFERADGGLQLDEGRKRVGREQSRQARSIQNSDICGIICAGINFCILFFIIIVAIW
jgi:hypothetical protein